MHDAIDEMGQEPLYYQIFCQLRDEIKEGIYDKDGVLPSEKRLEDRFEVSRITVRRAIDELARSGIVDRAKGRVTRINVWRTPTFADVDQELGNMLVAISNLQTKVINFRWIVASAFLAGKLHVHEGEKVLWISRLRSRPTGPVMFTSLYLPRWAADGLTRKDLAENAIVDILRSRGVIMASADQTMSAAPCSARLAPLLDLEPNAPIFFIRRLIRNIQDKPVMFNDISFRWDSFAYQLQLEPIYTRANGENKSERKVVRKSLLLQP